MRSYSPLEQVEVSVFPERVIGLENSLGTHPTA